MFPSSHCSLSASISPSWSHPVGAQSSGHAYGVSLLSTHVPVGVQIPQSCRQPTMSSPSSSSQSRSSSHSGPPVVVVVVLVVVGSSVVLVVGVVVLVDGVVVDVVAELVSPVEVTSVVVSVELSAVGDVQAERNARSGAMRR